MAEGIISEITKKTIVDQVREGIRPDGRRNDEIRRVKITTGVIENAHGSAMVELGMTKVLAGVKLEPGEPYPDRLDEGVLSTGAELTPLASPDFEVGPPDPYSVEVARVVDRAIRESEMISTKKLCITAGEKVWMVYLDVYALDMDGNLFDSGVLAGAAALLTTKMPKMEGDEVVAGETAGPLCLENLAVSVTYAKIGSTIVVDPTVAEESVMDARLTLGISEDEKICSLQKGGPAGFDFAEIDRMVEDSFGHAAQLRKRLRELG